MQWRVESEHWTPYWHWVGPPLLWNRLSFLWQGFFKMLETFEIAIHIHMIESHKFCRFVCCTFMLQISHFITSHNCSTGSGLVSEEATESTLSLLSCSWQQCVTHCIIILEAAFRRQSATILRYAVEFKRWSIGIKWPEVYQENLTHTINTSLDLWTKAVMSSCCWCQILTLQDSSDQFMFFWPSADQFCRTCAHCSLRFLFLVGKTKIWAVNCPKIWCLKTFCPQN